MQTRTGLGVGLVFVVAGVVIGGCSGSADPGADGTSGSSTSSGGASSSSSSSGGSGDDAALSSDDCMSRCMVKATGCGGVPESSENPGGTEGYCENLCASGLTNSQMSCLEAKSCGDLATKSPTSLCPPPPKSTSSSSGTSGSSSSSGGTSSSSGSPQTKKKKGDACECDISSTSDKGIYKQCIGNASACFDLNLACLADLSTGKGECVISCSSSTPCPKGSGTCQSSGKKSISGGVWMVCE